MRALLAAVVIAVGAFAVPLHAAHAADASPAVPDVFEARAEAGGEHDSVAVPAYFETFFPYSLSEASNGSAHSLNGVFYAGFFLTAAAQQQGFPAPPGTTETLYPQGPTSQSADVVPAPNGAFGSSSATSGPNGASGHAIAGGGDLPGVGHLGFGEVTTSVNANANGAVSTAIVVMHDITVGGVLRIGAISGSATADATGEPGGAVTSGRIALSDVTVLGAPIDVFSSIPGVGDPLAPAGVTITQQPDIRTAAPDGTAAHMHLGGVTITFSQPQQEFTLEVTFGRLDVSARALHVTQLGPTVLGPAVQSDVVEQVQPGSQVAPESLVAAPSLPTGTSTIRTVRRIGARSPDFSALAAVIALAALGALFTRRALRVLIDR